MKNRHLYLSLIITAFVFMLISGCSNLKSPDSPELTTTNNVKTLAKDDLDTTEIQQILTYFQQNNLEHGCFFFNVSDQGFGLGVFDFATGKNAFFYGHFGSGDYLRMNPDGTYSVKLNTTQADAQFFKYYPPYGFYVCTGTAHMDYNFSGTDYFIIPNYGLIMIPDNSISAAVLQGNATVYDITGVDPNPHTLHSHYVVNPGGQRHFVIHFN